ncbi:transposase [Streptosporangium sp. NPDC049046]|uniref:transposase n=1 Tax=Streptosporangium sp. NPDC049046 TaxID=3155031 RepID=UPI00343CD02F
MRFQVASRLVGIAIRRSLGSRGKRNDRVPAVRKYPDDLRSHAVQLYRESDPKPAISRLAEHLGVHREALRTWIREDEATHQDDDQLVTIRLAELRDLRKKNAELKRANEILRAASALFAAELMEVG